MGRQSAEMGRSRSPLGDRSGPSRQPQRSAGLETTGWSRGRPSKRWAAGEEKLVLLPDGQTYANSVARKLQAGPTDWIGWARPAATGVAAEPAGGLQSIKRSTGRPPDRRPRAGDGYSGASWKGRAAAGRVSSTRAAVHAPTQEPKKSPVPTGRWESPASVAGRMALPG